jgi:uncharacterized phage protein (TIGR02220 family)
LRKTCGFNKRQDWISQKQISEVTGIHKCHISRTIKKLSEKNMIIISRIKNKKIIGIQENCNEWKLPKEVTNSIKKLPVEVTEVTSRGNPKLPVGAHTKKTITKETVTNNIYSRDDLISDFFIEVKKEDPIDQIKEIIEYLNTEAGKNFRINSKSTIKDIKARLNEGFSLEDFKKVINTKCHKWKNTEYDIYLRPETLFGTKFESYLNEKIIEKENINYEGPKYIKI